MRNLDGQGIFSNHPSRAGELCEESEDKREEKEERPRRGGEDEGEDVAAMLLTV
jgi:hypothetical protein